MDELPVVYPLIYADMITHLCPDSNACLAIYL